MSCRASSDDLKVLNLHLCALSGVNLDVCLNIIKIAAVISWICQRLFTRWQNVSLKCDFIWKGLFLDVPIWVDYWQNLIDLLSQSNLVLYWPGIWFPWGGPNLAKFYLKFRWHFHAILLLQLFYYLVLFRIKQHRYAYVCTSTMGLLKDKLLTK